MEASSFHDVTLIRLRNELKAARASEKRAIDLAEERLQEIFKLQEELDKLKPEPPEDDSYDRPGDTAEQEFRWPEPPPEQLRYR